MMYQSGAKQDDDVTLLAIHAEIKETEFELGLFYQYVVVKFWGFCQAAGRKPSPIWR